MVNRHEVAHAAAGPFAYWGLVLKDFAQAWLTYGILTIVIAGITHGIYGIPLWQVSDVILALFLFFVAFVASLSLIGCCLDLTRAEFVLALGRLINIALLPFLPFGMVLGFLGYGFISGQSFATESFVYAGYVGVFADAYTLATSFAGDFLALMKADTRVAGSTELVVDTERLVFLAQIASVLLAIAGFMVGRVRATRVGEVGVRTSPFALFESSQPGQG
jgi:hypothetical protein